jgi:hypothetical protein
MIWRNPAEDIRPSHQALTAYQTRFLVVTTLTELPRLYRNIINGVLMFVKFEPGADDPLARTTNMSGQYECAVVR